MQYRELEVWQKGKSLAVLVYRATTDFPREEIYGLVSQMRRAAISVPSNTAEGQGRLTRGEWKLFLGHSRGSLLELETQIEIASELGFITRRKADTLLESTAEVGRLLNGLIRYVAKPGPK